MFDGIVSGNKPVFQGQRVTANTDLDAQVIAGLEELQIVGADSRPELHGIDIPCACVVIPHRILPAAEPEPVTVAAHTTVQMVVADSAIEGVVARLAVEHVVTVAAEQKIVAGSAIEQIGPGFAVQHVVAAVAAQVIIAGAAIEGVVRITENGTCQYVIAECS